MRAVPGVCTNRELSNGNFTYQGLTFQKSLDSKAMDTFLSKTTEPYGNLDVQNCAPVSFQDPHSIGAIFAHGFYRLLAYDTEKTAQQRAGVLINWAKNELDQNVFSQHADDLKELLNSAAYSIAKVVSDSSATKLLTSEQCSAFSEVFPVAAQAKTSELATLGCKK